MSSANDVILIKAKILSFNNELDDVILMLIHELLQNTVVMGENMCNPYFVLSGRFV